MAELFQWYWIIFLVPFAFGILMALGAAVSMGADGDMDADADVDGDIDDADLDNGSFKMLSILGVGKVPLSFIMTSMGLTFGTTGLLLNKIIGTELVIVSLPAAFFSMLLFTRYISKAIAAFMPQTETYITNSKDLIGKIGKVTIRTDQLFGQAHVHDDSGTLHSVKCRTTEGFLDINTQVLLIDYENSFYLVEKAPDLSS